MLKTVIIRDDVLLRNIAIQDDQNGSLIEARKEIITAQKSYFFLRDGDEKIGVKSLSAYNALLQILNKKLMEKYDAK